jgi:hypothetical protein
MRDTNDMSELDLLRQAYLDAYAFHTGLALEGKESTQESRDALQYLSELIEIVARAETERTAVPALLSALEVECVCPLCNVSVPDVTYVMETLAGKRQVFLSIKYAAEVHGQELEDLRNHIIATAAAYAATLHDHGKQGKGRRA